MKALASAVAASGRWGGRGLLKVAPCFRISILFLSFHHCYQFSAIASTVHEAGAGWRRFENVRARQRASDSICGPESSGEKVTRSGGSGGERAGGGLWSLSESGSCPHKANLLGNLKCGFTETFAASSANLATRNAVIVVGSHSWGVLGGRQEPLRNQLPPAFREVGGGKGRRVEQPPAGTRGRDPACGFNTHCSLLSVSCRPCGALALALSL